MELVSIGTDQHYCIAAGDVVGFGASHRRYCLTGQLNRWIVPREHDAEGGLERTQLPSAI
jgi:hypothetical protein